MKEMMWISFDVNLKLQDWKKKKLNCRLFLFPPLPPCSFCCMLVSAVSCCERFRLRGEERCKELNECLPRWSRDCRGTLERRRAHHETKPQRLTGKGKDQLSLTLNSQFLYPLPSQRTRCNFPGSLPLHISRRPPNITPAASGMRRNAQARTWMAADETF